MIKLLLRILLEIVIAIAIFIALINFLPLFNNQGETAPSTFNVQPGNDNKNFDQVRKVFAGEDNSILKAIEDEPHTNSVTITGNVSAIKNSCTLPRSKEKIAHDTQVIAYKNAIADGENVCKGEIRICNDGILLGGYQFKTCSYTIDGINKGKEIIPGATQTTHTLFTFIKGQNVPQEFIQPPRYEYPTRQKEQEYFYNLHGQRITNPIQQDSIHVSQSAYQGVLNNAYQKPIIRTIKKGCNLPRSGSIAHGRYIIAYQHAKINSKNVCLFEKRPCINGTLLGSFTSPTCSHTITHPKSPLTQDEEIPLGQEINVDDSNPIANDALPAIKTYNK